MIALSIFKEKATTWTQSKDIFNKDPPVCVKKLANKYLCIAFYILPTSSYIILIVQRGNYTYEIS